MRFLLKIKTNNGKWQQLAFIRSSKLDLRQVFTISLYLPMQS